MVFILHECNENMLMDIFKLEELFGMNFFSYLYALEYYVLIIKRR